MIHPSYPYSNAGAVMSAEEYRARQANPGDPVARLRGRCSREKGAAFEELLSTGCEHYAKRNVALIEKTPEPMAVKGRLQKDRFVAVFTKKAQADYKGTLAGGRAIVFEAKHTDGEQIRQSVVTKEQTRWLNAHYQLGAHCFVLVSLGVRDFYRVPWADWCGMKARYGRGYMKRPELAPYAVPAGLCETGDGKRRLGVHFLQGLEE